MGDDGIQVPDLIGGGIRIACRLIRTTPPEKIKCHDSARRRKVREQTIVEVYVVGEACIRMIDGSAPGWSRTYIRCSLRCTERSWYAIIPSGRNVAYPVISLTDVSSPTVAVPATYPGRRLGGGDNVSGGGAVLETGGRAAPRLEGLKMANVTVTSINLTIHRDTPHRGEECTVNIIWDGGSGGSHPACTNDAIVLVGLLPSIYVAVRARPAT